MLSESLLEYLQEYEVIPGRLYDRKCMFDKTDKPANDFLIVSLLVTSITL